MNHASTEKGISLLIVLLIGSVMILTAVGVGVYGLQSVRSTQIRTESTRAMYGAEEAFGCVKYWINKHPSYLTNTAGYDTITCNTVVFKFDNNNADSATYKNVANVGTSEFRIPDNPAEPLRGGVDVKVIRDSSKTWFQGTVEVLSYSDDASTDRVTQRKQIFNYVRRLGADIIFVIDRSGSIEGSRVVGSETGEWADLVHALASSTIELLQEIPQPQLGYVTFGRDANDVGTQVSVGDCESALGVAAGDIRCSTGVGNLRDTEVQLTSNGAALLTASTSPNIDEGNSTTNATNLSLGIAIAASELIGRYYPHGAYADPVSALPYGWTTGKGPGEFERIVAVEQDIDDLINDLPVRPVSTDRTDDDFADVIVIITDGEPNGIMTFAPPTLWSTGLLDSSTNNWASFSSDGYDPGVVKLFRTAAYQNTTLIVDNSALPNPALTTYEHCNDLLAAGGEPSDLSSGSPRGIDAPNNEYPYPAMCNVTQIVDVLEQDSGSSAELGITFAVIGVGTTADTQEWLQKHVATDPDLFVPVNDYNEVNNAILMILEQLDLVEQL